MADRRTTARCDRLRSQRSTFAFGDGRLSSQPSGEEAYRDVLQARGLAGGDRAPVLEQMGQWADATTKGRRL